MTRKYTRTYTKKPPKKHIVFYSGGICSWMTAKVVIDKEGADNVLLYFTDTKTESPDLYRFLKETSTAFGAELMWDADGRDIWQVFQDERFVGNSRNDPCSKILKRRKSKRYISQFSPQDVTLYIGLDWTEEHRYIKSKEFWKPYNLLAPLCSPPPPHDKGTNV